MHPRRAFVMVVMLAVLQFPSPAWAEVSTSGWSDGNGVGAHVGVDDTTPTTSRGSSAPSPCTYQQLNDQQSGESVAVGDPHGSGDGSWYSQVCSYTDSVTVMDIWVPQRVNTVAVAQQALQYTPLPTPSIDLSPSTNQIQLVNLPVWLSLGNATWTPISAQASAGGVTVTTTATPTRVVWHTGDGSTVTCGGPGQHYDATIPDSAQHSDCTYTYRTSSAGQSGDQYTLSATEEWHVTWTAAGAPAGTPAAGDLGVLTRTSTVPVRVGEVQALNEEN